MISLERKQSEVEELLCQKYKALSKLLQSRLIDEPEIMDLQEEIDDLRLVKQSIDETMEVVH